MKAGEKKWLQLFWSFLKIGLFSYGGFMSMIAFSKKEVVNKGGYISENDFQDGIAYVSLLPGPTALNFCGYVGFLFLGNLGLFLAVLAASLPSLILLWIIGWLYLDGFSPEQLTPVFRWIPFGITSIILFTGFNMFQKQKHERKHIISLVVLLLFIFSPLGTALTLLIIIAISAIYKLGKSGIRINRNFTFNKAVLAVVVAGLIFIAIPFDGLQQSPVTDFLKISKYSLGLLGGGYVFIPLMDDLMVAKEAWISSNVFYDGIAFGQVTPGPIMISMFFFGYYVHGFTGGFLYFLGIILLPLLLTRIFAPSFRSLIQNEFLGGVFTIIRLIVVSAILFSGLDILMRSVDLSDYTNLAMSLGLTTGLFILQRLKVFSVFHVIGACILIGLIFAA